MAKNPTTRAVVILEGKGGELGRTAVEIPADAEDPESAWSDVIQDAIEDWLLSPGDTIRIVEQP